MLLIQLSLPPMRNLFVILLAAFLFTGCSEYSKVLKSNDYAYKFEKAKEYYAEGECTKALPLFEEMLSIYRLTAKGEDVFYYYSQTNYCAQEFYVAGYYFKSFVKTYPGSPRAEECAFLGAMCSVMNSPEIALDQTETTKAIDELQLFLNRYPNTNKQDTCNAIIKTMRLKLEVKAVESAKLYYQMEQYKAAAFALKNVLVDYPDIRFKEDILHYIVKSNFKFAENSVEKKKQERYAETIKSYHKFADAFPESTELKEAETMYNSAVKELERLKLKK